MRLQLQSRPFCDARRIGEKTQTSALCELPQDALESIFTHLGVQDLASCAQVAKAWHAQANADWIWRKLAYKLQGATGTTDTTTSPKAVIERQYKIATNMRADTPSRAHASHHKKAVTRVRFSPDGSMLASASLDHTARLFDVKSGQVLLTVQHGAAVRGVCISPDKKLLATASWDKTCRLTDIATGTIYATVGHENWVTDACFSPDGRLLATASHDGTARLTDVASMQEVAQVHHRSGVTAVAFSLDGRLLASGSFDGATYLTGLCHPAPTSCIQRAKNITALQFSPNGTHLAMGFANGTAEVLDTRTMATTTCVSHRARICDLSFSTDGTRLATAAREPTARITELASGHLFAKLPGAPSNKSAGAILSASFGPSGSLWATAAADHAVRWMDYDPLAA